MIGRYGFKFPDGTKDTTIELMAFAYGAKEERYSHMCNAINLLENQLRPNSFIWNEWPELMMRIFCEYDEVPVSGPSASWKTTTAAWYANKVWQAAPAHTKVILTSTTLDALRAKLWKEVVHCYRIAEPFGNLVQSRTCIQWTKGDDGAGIFGAAISSDGDVDKVVNKIKGRHEPRVLVICDEMATVNEAIVEACINLQAGCEWFQFIGIANPESELDPHGQMSEPKDGWDSISVESETWETKRGGMAIHLNGRKSPNLRNDIYPGLIRQRDIDATIRNYGEDSPQFWRERLGFWAPQGISKTVLSPATISKFHARDPAVWVESFTLGAGLDPAYEGGDRCILRIGKCGEADEAGKQVEPFRSDLRQGKMTLSLEDTIQIKVQVSSTEPLHYQIVRQVKHECESRGIPPSMFALDSTGEGGGLASIFQKEWSPEIVCVEFGGRPSNRPLSPTNPKPASQEYDRRVTELWYQFRNLVTNNQIRNLDAATASEFCRRYFEVKGSITYLETKIQMKTRTKRSPDLADATCILAELFLQKIYSFKSDRTNDLTPDNRWKEFAAKLDVSNEEEAYSVTTLDA